MRDIITHHENNVGSQDAAHGVTDNNDIGSRRLVWCKPLAKVVSRNVDGTIRLVAWVKLGVDDMRVR